MGLFKQSSRNTPRKSSVECPECGSKHLGLGYVDRVARTVLHGCDNCGARWRDHLIDLADKQLAARTR